MTILPKKPKCYSANAIAACNSSGVSRPSSPHLSDVLHSELQNDVTSQSQSIPTSSHDSSSDNVLSSSGLVVTTSMTQSSDLIVDHGRCNSNMGVSCHIRNYSSSSNSSESDFANNSWSDFYTDELSEDKFNSSSALPHTPTVSVSNGINTSSSSSSTSVNNKTAVDIVVSKSIDRHQHNMATLNSTALSNNSTLCTTTSSVSKNSGLKRRSTGVMVMGVNRRRGPNSSPNSASNFTNKKTKRNKPEQRKWKHITPQGTIAQQSGGSPCHQPQGALGCGLGSSSRDRESPSSPTSTQQGYNSEDEYHNRNVVRRYGGGGLSDSEWNEMDNRFEKNLLKRKGWILKHMVDDGSCLFRAVADQIYGDQEMHVVVRNHCMNYLLQNGDYFSQYLTEHIESYVERKRFLGVQGNHLEIQAISEMYNRPVHIFCYKTEPINIFQATSGLDYTTPTSAPSPPSSTSRGVVGGGTPPPLPRPSTPEVGSTGSGAMAKVSLLHPIRLSYQRQSHYNSIVDPSVFSVGVGLGLPGLSSPRNKYQEDEVERKMLEDKLYATDWEATSDAIEEQVARESYIEWLKIQNQPSNQMKKAKTNSSVCHQISQSFPNQEQFQRFSPPSSPSTGGPSSCTVLESHQSSTKVTTRSSNNKYLTGLCGHNASSSTSSLNSPKAGCSHDRDSPKPPCRSAVVPAPASQSNTTTASQISSRPHMVKPASDESSVRNSSPPHNNTVPVAASKTTNTLAPSSSAETTNTLAPSLSPSVAEASFSTFTDPDIAGCYTGWSESEVLAHVLATSQQQYMDSLKQQMQ